MSGDKDAEAYSKQVADAAASLDTQDFDDLPSEEIDAFDEAADKARKKTRTNPSAVDGPPDSNAKQKLLPVSDFIAFSPRHTYIHRSTGDVWTATSVNARVAAIPFGASAKPLSASKWLDGNDAVEQKVWAPGDPQVIENRLVAVSGFFAKQGARVFNLYKPPEIIAPINRGVGLWRDHLYALWPSEAKHIEQWFAHRVQRPGEKINHALVLGGKPGIGKDAIIEPLKRAVGPWNFAEISPQAALGNFNEFARSVVLRISEGKDLGDIDRFAFYEATKTLIAAPPDTLRVNPKFVPPYYAVNVTGVIITTNHKVGGLFLPADDRRHFVAWSFRERTDFDDAYWTEYWRWLGDGGREAVAEYLRQLDLTGFNPKAPPPQTQAFWEMVNATRSEEESEMSDVIESLGTPKALMISDLVRKARTTSRHVLVQFLQDRKNARTVAIRLEECGYRRLANPKDKRGRWRVSGQRASVYVRDQLTDREGFAAVQALKGFEDDAT
jgi:hypothetical protein